MSIAPFDWSLVFVPLIKYCPQSCSRHITTAFGALAQEPAGIPSCDLRPDARPTGPFGASPGSLTKPGRIPDERNGAIPQPRDNISRAFYQTTPLFDA